MRIFHKTMKHQQKSCQSLEGSAIGFSLQALCVRSKMTTNISISNNKHRHHHQKPAIKEFDLNQFLDTNQLPEMLSSTKSHHTHHRNSLVSGPNSICRFIYKIWTYMCLFDPAARKSGHLQKTNSIDPNHSDTDEDGYNTYHTGVITRAFLPMRLVLMAMGRWPFLLILRSVSIRPKHHINLTPATILNRIRVLNYDSNLKSPVWIYFGLTTLFIFFVLIMSTLGFLDFFMEWNFLPLDRWATVQKNTFRNNLVMFLLVWGCLLHSTLSSFSMFLNRKQITQSLNFWNVAAEELQIGSVKRHRRFLILANIGYVLFLILIYFAYSWWNIRFVRDGATLFGTLVIRPLLSQQQLRTTPEWRLRVFGILMIIYCVYASRAFLFIFCFKCRLLRSMFRAWNQRLAKYLDSKEFKDQDKEKMISERMLKEMTILLRMVKQQDAMFATILQTYYAIQVKGNTI